MPETAGFDGVGHAEGETEAFVSGQTVHPCVPAFDVLVHGFKRCVSLRGLKPLF